MLLPALLLVVACASACSAPAASPPKPATPVSLKIGFSVPKTGSAAAGLNSFVNNRIADTFVDIGWDGRPLDRLLRAESAEWLDDGRALRIALQPGLKFHDGTAIGRDSFRKLLESILKSPAQAGANVSYGSVISVDLDPSSEDGVIIRLSRPEAFLLTDLANSTLTPPDKPDIGTGPFRLISRTPTVRLAAFEDYYRGRPKIDFLEVHEFDEQRATWAALMRQEIDAVHEISPNAIDFIQAEGQTNVQTFPFVRPYFYQLMFNVRHPVLKKVAVRQALSYAIDRQALIDLALNKQGVVAEGPVWPFHWAYSSATKVYSHNIEAAILRLDAAGLKITRPGKPDQMPSRLRIRCLTVAKDARYEKIALVLQKQLYEIGVELEIEAVPGRELVKRLTSGDFDTLLIERTTGRSLAWTYLTFHSSQSPTGYTAADKVLDHLRQTTEDAQVREDVSVLQQIIHDDPPAIFIAWPKVARVVSSRFTVEGEQGRDVLSSLWHWKPASPSP
jgi:peptide/nickel transport system substrate-binding protein